MSHLPEPQSPSSQQYFAHCVPRQVEPASQNGPFELSHAPQSLVSFGGSKQLKPELVASHAAPFAPSQPSFVTGLHGGGSHTAAHLPEYMPVC